MKILITGAEGFLGSHLAERLASLGHKVKAFIIPPGLGVNYKTGTWHFPLIATEDMNFLVVDRKGSGDNLKIQKLEENWKNYTHQTGRQILIV